MTFEEEVTYCGTKFIIFSTKTPRFDNSGKLSGLYSVSKDVTEYRRAMELRS